MHIKQNNIKYINFITNIKLTMRFIKKNKYMLTYRLKVLYFVKIVYIHNKLLIYILPLETTFFLEKYKWTTNI